MKKKLILLLCLIALLAMTAACGSQSKTFPSGVTSDDIVQAVLDADENTPQAEHRYANDSEQRQEIDTFTLSLIEDGLFEECPEFALIKEYALYICNSKETFEVQVLKAANEENAEQLKALLDRRLETLSGGDKSMYDPSFAGMMQNAKTYTDGPFAILLITPDNTRAQEAIEKLK
ncbi:MAG: DUF4358 domain-containing protein [Clostridiales bacterium]|nr:DUF4358 domain-containing protein [Clostridiales bacterium]